LYKSTFKYVFHCNGGCEQLFDLQNDPDEMHNIAAQQPDYCARCRAKLATSYQERGLDEALENGALKVLLTQNATRRFEMTFEMTGVNTMMKRALLLGLSLGIATASYAATPPKVLLAQADHAQQLAQVKAGTLKTAQASWWGFDKTDATECLQNAINSGVPKLIVDNTGSDWIVNKPIQLVSHQEIVFKDGVVIQAKKGAFKGKMDSLFAGRKLSKVSLIGEGNATFRMQRDDYANPALYEKAEWRHGIGLWDCSNVIIRGLTVTETGGDGLYLGASGSGFNKNVLVENCNFDKNYRQGISVISAEDLTIRHCKLTNTKGTAPQAGIDYEPNQAGQRLVNCILEDCVLTGNSGGGLDIYAVNLKDSSLPISITVNRCTFAQNSLGVASTITRNADDPAVAHIAFNDCSFDHDRIQMRNALVGSSHYTFTNCTLDYTPIPGKKLTGWRNVPIILTTDQGLEKRAVGGVKFENMRVKGSADLVPLGIRFQGQGNLSDTITGNLLVENNGTSTPFDLAGFIAKERSRLAAINALQPATLHLANLHAPTSGAARQGNSTFYTRNKFTFLQYAKAGESITLNVTARKVYPRETEVELLDPSGKKLQTYTIPYTNKPVPITFTAEQTGIYRLVRTQNFSQRMDVTSANPGNGILLEDGMDFLPLNGKLYFEVPVGVQKFTLGISTDSTADVALLNPAGQEVERHNGIGSLQLFSATRADASDSEIWSLDVSKAVWSVVVHFYGDLNPIVSTNPATLLRSKE